MKYLPLLLLVALMGCQERYRYPCQDPANWNEDFCKKPICSANGTCPEDLTPYEKDKVGAAPENSNVQPSPSKGDCK